MHSFPVEEWPKRKENLERVHFSLLNFLESRIKLQHPLLTEELDLVSLAINSERSALMKLLKLAMLAITNCEKKDVFITRIMKMNEVVQTHMMIFIREAMEKEEEKTDDGENSVPNPSELSKLKKDKRELTSKLNKLRMQMDLLMHSKAASDKQIEELKMRNLDLENELIRRVKSESMNPARDSLVTSLEASVIQKERSLASLQTQLEEERKINESKISALKDELDVANEHISHMSSVEATLQKYKTRLEEFTDARNKLRAVTEDNETLRKQLKSLRDQCELQSSNIKQTSSAKDELTKSKVKIAKLEEQLQDREKQLKDLRMTNKDLEEKLQLSDIRCKETAEQLDRFLHADSSSEDSFCVRSPHPEEVRNSRKSTFDQLGFNEMASATEGRERRYREIVVLTNEMAQLKFLKVKAEEELQGVKSVMAGEVARLKTEQSTASSQHIQETQSFTSKIHTLESELNSLERRHNTEKADLLAKVQFFEMHFKQVDEDLKALKREKETLIAETRCLRKEKEDLTTRYLESREQEVKLVRELSEKQVKFQATEAERMQVVQRLEEATNALKIIDGKMMGESEAGRLRSQMLEFERKIIAVQAELAESQKQTREKDDQMRVLQADATKWRHLSIQKDSDISFLTRAKEELNKALSEERRLLFEVMQEMDTRLSDLSSSAIRERASKMFHS